jgi:hypothetical protein
MRYEVIRVGDRYAVRDVFYKVIHKGRFHRPEQADAWMEERRRLDLVAMLKGDRDKLHSRDRAAAVAGRDFYAENERAIAQASLRR